MPSAAGASSVARSTAKTRTPWPASEAAVAAPSPEAAPVTTAETFSSFMGTPRSGPALSGPAATFQKYPCQSSSSSFGTVCGMSVAALSPAHPRGRADDPYAIHRDVRSGHADLVRRHDRAGDGGTRLRRGQRGSTGVPDRPDPADPGRPGQGDCPDPGADRP